MLQFILTFLGSYFLFSLVYNFYLELSQTSQYYPDFFTHLVAAQSETLIEAFGYSSKILPHQNEPSMKLYIDNNLLARVVEGCNSLSIIILFISFILSFFARIKTTLLFILAGAAIIYAMNIIRIAILTIGIYEYPKYAEFLHSIIFPLIIYGTVFLLWIVWVRLYSNSTAHANA